MYKKCELVNNVEKDAYKETATHYIRVADSINTDVKAGEKWIKL